MDPLIRFHPNPAKSCHLMSRRAINSA
ncbi:hypothetical protein F383_01584 [Gossypium arboreum]|uniref:Uncharacterized protein n=1 Tax=Gossypium arboreum TaxID=29729 RepID=A0A0B0PPT1_GOSAR|nr:hypothetical protein F383_01584 [Gossypium arboreum]